MCCFPGCSDCSVRTPACGRHQLSMTGCMDLKVVKANGPSVWGWCRHITEMIMDNSQIDVLPQGGWRGFVLHVFQQTWFKNSWMHLVVCSYPLFFRYSGTAKNLLSKSLIGKVLYSELRRKSVQFSWKSPKHSAVNWKDGVFFRSRFPRVSSIMQCTFQSILEQNIL